STTRGAATRSASPTATEDALHEWTPPHVRCPYTLFPCRERRAHGHELGGVGQGLAWLPLACRSRIDVSRDPAPHQRPGRPSAVSRRREEPGRIGAGGSLDAAPHEHGLAAPALCQRRGIQGHLVA